MSHWVGRELNEKKIQMESGHLAIAQIEVDLSCSPWANMLLIVVLKYKYLNKT